MSDCDRLITHLLQTIINKALFTRCSVSRTASVNTISKGGVSCLLRLDCHLQSFFSNGSGLGYTKELAHIKSPGTGKFITVYISDQLNL